jgi:tetratricopeptide (TPR) repeat protein
MTADDSDLPLGQKLRQLWRRISGAHDWAAQEKLMQQAQRIEDIVVSRNLKGIEHEKAGRVAKAVELYEANVADRFDGSHPYDRLRVIDTRDGKFEDAIRICEAYIQFGQERDVDGKAKYRKTIENLKRKLLERAEPVIAVRHEAH